MQCGILISHARTARIGLPLSLVHALDSLPSAAGVAVVEVSWFKQPTHEVAPSLRDSLWAILIPVFLLQVRSTASLVITRTAAWSGEGARTPDFRNIYVLPIFDFR
jgi:hypothetical protein